MAPVPTELGITRGWTPLSADSDDRVRKELFIRCDICDRLLDEPKLNPDYGEFDPCATCIAVIEDTLSSYTQKPAASETDLGIDPLWDEMFPPTYDPLDSEV